MKSSTILLGVYAWRFGLDLGVCRTSNCLTHLKRISGSIVLDFCIAIGLTWRNKYFAKDSASVLAIAFQPDFGNRFLTLILFDIWPQIR